MDSSVDFFKSDFFSTLFPMETSKYLIEKGSAEIENFITRCISDNAEDRSFQFIAQTRVYGAKPHNHLRRTVKLDPVAEYFIYDMIYKNRNRFRTPFHNDKKHFGYRFEAGNPISASTSYAAFKKAMVAYKQTFKYSLCFDVASYFNGIYHHDLVAWFANMGAEAEDVQALGAFLRKSNSGKSIDCLPQGLYPAKMIGNDFLRIVEQHHSLKASAVLRFMDDFAIYGNSMDELNHDFYLIQKLLGQKGLSVNPSKTVYGQAAAVQADERVDEVKATLLRKRRNASARAYFEDFEGAKEEIQLTDAELTYLMQLLENPSLEEEDAELALNLFRENPEHIIPHLETFLVAFPHLTKNIWSLCKSIDDNATIGEIVCNVAANDRLQEYQLFWLGWMLQDFSMNTRHAAETIDRLFNHRNSTVISKAKILEIPDNRFGLIELRDEHLVAGRSDWLAWGERCRTPKFSSNFTKP